MTFEVASACAVAGPCEPELLPVILIVCRLGDVAAICIISNCIAGSKYALKISEDSFYIL
ncbi:MAG: hypothetical protein AB8B66_02675 [Rickettsiaceae bacterium]